MCFALIILAVLAHLAYSAATQPIALGRNARLAQSALPALPLTIRATSGDVHFVVEVARTFAQQRSGLMFRRSLPLRAGMIFPINPIQNASFWMKDTLIPLDLVFIRADGTIARIITARPLDERLKSAGEPVAAVLEIGAGRARMFDIRESDRVEWKGLR